MLKGKKGAKVGNATTIELNGKRYDASSGVLLGAVHGKKKQVASAAHHSAHAGRAIDGVVRAEKPMPVFAAAPAQSVVRHHAAHGESQTSQAAAHKKPKVKRFIKPAAAHQPQKPKTLMRRGVLKPRFSLKPAIKAQLPAEVAARPVHAVAPKMSVTQVDPIRLAHSRHAAHSTAIRRFNFGRFEQQQRGNASANLPATAQAVQHIPVRPAPHPGTAPMRQDVLRATPKPPADMFESAIAHATSHRQPAPIRKRHHSRLMILVVVALLFLAAAGAVTYANRPAIEVRLASSQAGFHASLPKAPTGYALVGAPKSGKGDVILTFASGDSSFKLVQQPTNLTSQSLFTTDEALDTNSYQTVVAGNALIYRYGGTNAAWVDNGVLYTLTGNAQLSNDQLIALAASL